MNATVVSCTLPLPTNYRMMDILTFHNRDALAVAETVEGNCLGKGIIWQGAPACLTVRFLPLCAEIELSIDHPLASAKVDELTALATRMLGLDQAVEIFEEGVARHPQLGKLIQKQSGLRVPVAPSVFEALTWAITGQKISVAAAVSIRRKLIQLVGLPHSSGLYCYPDAQLVKDLSINELRQTGFSQSKAQTLLTVSQMVASGELVLNISKEEPSIAQIRQQLLAVRGIGPWTVNYALLRGYGWLDGSLHGDAAVRRGLQMLLDHDGVMDENQTQKWLEGFAPWRALVAAHLWELVANGG